MPKGDFGNKRNTNGFAQTKKGGRPKKVINTLLEYVKEKYKVKVCKSEMQELKSLVEGMPPEKLKEFVQDPEIPAAIQAYGRLILTGDSKDFRRLQGAEILSNRVHGTPKQTMQHTIKEPETIDYSKYTDAELEHLDQLLSKGRISEEASQRLLSENEANV